jgi:SPP1 gp7 family putative phage head morphogenesis protein
MANPAQAFILREVSKKTSPQQISKILNRTIPNIKTIETRHNGALQRQQIELNRWVREQIQPLTKTVLRQDAPYQDPISRLFDEMAAGILQFLLGAGWQNAINGASNQTLAYNQAKYSVGVYDLLGINDVPASLTQDIVNNWTANNVNLIQNANAKQLRSLETLFRDAMFAQTRASELRSSVNKIFKGTRNNVALIASDQVQKLDGQLDQYKQTQAGIDGYYWRTRMDERVRIQHAEREGKFFRWDSPPSGGHPKMAIRCRCNAEPAIDKFLLTGRERRQVESARIVAYNKDRAKAIARSKGGK